MGWLQRRLSLAHPFFELDSKPDSIRKPSLSRQKKLTKLNDFAHFFTSKYFGVIVKSGEGGGGGSIRQGRYEIGASNANLKAEGRV